MSTPDKRVLSRPLHPALLGAIALLIVGAAAAGTWFVRARWQRSAPPAQVDPLPSAPDQANSRRGRLLYQVNCQSCHGSDGHGDGTAAAEMKPPPRDFAVAPWKFGATEDAIRRVIRHGSAGTAMPGFALLPQDDREALSAFVLSLAPPEAKETPRLPEGLAGRLQRLGFIPEDRPRFAPDLVLRDLEGRSHSLDRWSGKVVLLNFWGTTCVHCLAELPALEKIAHEVGDGFAVVSVCFDETDAGEVRRLVQGRVQQMPVYVNPDGLVRRGTMCKRCRVCT